MKCKSNDKVVQSFMKSHPMNSVFVLEAVTRYAKDVVVNKHDFVKEMSHSIISGELWVEIAENWLKNNK